MRVFKQILIKITWLLLYLVFNVVLCFIEIEFFFKEKSKTFENNTGSETLDVLLDVGGLFLNVLSSFALLSYMILALLIAVVSFICFIPLHFYIIKRRYQELKKRYWYGLLLTCSFVIIFKFIIIIWQLVEKYYL